MSEDELQHGRRSTRLSISIPVVLSGVDDDGNVFSENVRTLVVNRHGGKVATTHRMAMGSEASIENRASSIVVKATVVWTSQMKYPGDLYHVGLQLAEAQNVWGIAFPPEDWHLELSGDEVPAPEARPAPAPAESPVPETPVSSLAGEEITIRLLQELQHSADAHAEDFQDRLHQLTHRLGSDFEFALRERADAARAHEVGALEKELKILSDSLSAARAEMGWLETRIQDLQTAVEAATRNLSPPPPLEEVHQQLAALANSILENMNRAAEEGLSNYRSLLEKENQEYAVPRRPDVQEDPLPEGPAGES